MSRIKEISVFEAIRSMRAVRRYTDESVSDEDIRRILEAGTMAPSAGNSQPWEFLVLKDPSGKKKLQEYYDKAFGDLLASLTKQGEKMADVVKGLEEFRKSFAANLHTVPVMIIVCVNRGKLGIPKDDPDNVEQLNTVYGSIYPCVQNILLAARGLGLGSTITTLYCKYESEVKAYFGIPKEYQTVAMLPVGHAAVKPGPPKRVPVDNFIHNDNWGKK